MNDLRFTFELRTQKEEGYSNHSAQRATNAKPKKSQNYFKTLQYELLYFKIIFIINNTRTNKGTIKICKKEAIIRCMRLFRIVVSLFIMTLFARRAGLLQEVVDNITYDIL